MVAYIDLPNTYQAKKSCESKDKYATVSHAKMVGGSRLEHYRCGVCGYLHLTSKKDKPLPSRLRKKR